MGRKLRPNLRKLKQRPRIFKPKPRKLRSNPRKYKPKPRKFRPQPRQLNPNRRKLKPQPRQLKPNLRKLQPSLRKPKTHNRPWVLSAKSKMLLSVRVTKTMPSTNPLKAKSHSLQAAYEYVRRWTQSSQQTCELFHVCCVYT